MDNNVSSKGRGEGYEDRAEDDQHGGIILDDPSEGDEEEDEDEEMDRDSAPQQVGSQGRFQVGK